MLKSILVIIVQRILEFIYNKFQDWNNYKRTVQKQREKIEMLKNQLLAAESELDRREATKNLANNFPH
jgi:hypothetical protein